MKITSQSLITPSHVCAFTRVGQNPRSRVFHNRKETKTSHSTFSFPSLKSKRAKKRKQKHKHCFKSKSKKDHKSSFQSNMKSKKLTQTKAERIKQLMEKILLIYSEPMSHSPLVTVPSFPLRSEYQCRLRLWLQSPSMMEMKQSKKDPLPGILLWAVEVITIILLSHLRARDCLPLWPQRFRAFFGLPI